MLWAGPALQTDAIHRFRAVSPAAVWWNSSLVEALADFDETVDVLCHVPEPIWPRGSTRSPHSQKDSNGSATLVDYWNMPGVRTRSLFRNYLRAVQLENGVDTLVTYNPYNFALRLGTAAVDAELTRKWIGIFADPVTGGRKYSRRRTHAETLMDGGVYLSWYDYEAADRNADTPCLHLDGGIDVLRPARPFQPPKRPTALYTGSLTAHGGVDVLVDAVEFLDTDIQVVVCGKGSSGPLAKAVASERFSDRLSFLGLVDERTLHQLSLEATCFVNPRPTAGASDHNFPSKLLRYLGYGQPVASTRTLGLAPEYSAALVLADSDAPKDLARSIEEAIAACSDAGVATDRRSFVEARSWRSQAMRLRHFMGYV